MPLFSGSAWAFYTQNGNIYGDDGVELQIHGVNWFGFETPIKVVGGLGFRNWRDMIQQIKQYFTAVRLPLCPAALQSATPSGIDFTLNPDLQGLNSLQILDLVVKEMDRQGLYILLDQHRPGCDEQISGLWYTDTYSEKAWINDLVFVATRYQNLTHFLGIDLKNEPHDEATWGTDDLATDWKLASERAAAAILAANPNLLIFVEGVQENPVCSGNIDHWWGGNLEPVACFPPAIQPNKLVLSPHVYGPDVFPQSYFSDPNFPQNMPDIWETHFGFLTGLGYAVVIGEFGGKYGHGGDPRDKVWQDKLIVYMLDKGLTNFFYWTWNPNSGDTGGILKDDWQTVWQDKIELLCQLGCPLTLGDLRLPGAETGVSYGAPLVLGGVAPFTIALKKGALTPGLTADSATGRLTGTPTSTTSKGFTAQITDQLGASVTGIFKIKVVAAVSISTKDLKAGTSGKSYKGRLKAKKGKAPYNWSLVSAPESLPPGLDLQSSTGAITGVPTQPGTYNPTFQVTDSFGAQAQKGFTLTVN